MKRGVIVGVYIFMFATLIYAQSTEEQLTITTYYPAPYGSYRTLQILNNNQEILLGNDASNPSIEMRDTSGGGQTPYIDFSNDGTTDYDMRIILDGDNILSIKGGVLRIYDNSGNPGVMQVGEVWYCTSYP